ncbi:MAG TPA: hypothetical protein DCO86_00665 [Spirochaetaceae bacterium]|nr:hypothetical protein [Spirochaetaceae bacterium]
MISEEDIRKVVKADFLQMQGSSHAKEIELVKSAIKKEVGFLQRSSFLAYLFSCLHHAEMFSDSKTEKGPVKRAQSDKPLKKSGFEKPSRSEVSEKPVRKEESVKTEHEKNAASADAVSDVCSFWCNARLYNKGKIDEFLRYVEKESGIPEGSAFGYKCLKSFSFFKVKEHHGAKVKKRFEQPETHNGYKIVIRMRGERPAASKG